MPLYDDDDEEEEEEEFKWDQRAKSGVSSPFHICIGIPT